MLKSIFLVSGSVITTKDPFEDSVAVKSYMMQMKMSQDSFGSSKYAVSQGNTNMRLSYFPALIEAVMEYVSMEEKLSKGIVPEAAVGEAESGEYLVEYPGKEEMLQLGKAVNRNGRWEFKIAVVRKNAVSIKGAAAYEIGKAGNYEQVMFFALIPEFLKNVEFKEKYEYFRTSLLDYQKSTSETSKHSCWEAAAVLCDNVYQRCTYTDNCNAIDGSGMKIVCQDQGTQELLSISDIENVTVKKMHAGGEFKKFAGMVKKNVLAGHKMAELQLQKKWTVRSITNAFVRNPNRQLTDSEKLMMQATAAKLGEWYQVPKQLVKAAIAAKATYGKTIAFSNFYFYGEAGGGKTSAAMALSLALGIPYVSITFSANTEILDLLQSIAPETVDETGNVCSVAELVKEYPDSLSCALDPVASYEKITGKHKDDATPEEAMAAIFDKIAAGMNTSGQRFKYVDSPLAKAFRYGYLVELQEPNIVANPGVIVGLNSLLDRTATMVCQSGEIVNRHPDFIAVDTTNRSYAACRDVNASHLSRFHMALRFDKPSDDEMIERIKSNTGFDDTKTIRKMLKVQSAMCRVLQTSGEENYSCGTRELCNWISWYVLLGDAYESAKDTIIPLATQNEELMSELESCVLTEFV